MIKKNRPTKVAHMLGKKKDSKDKRAKKSKAKSRKSKGALKVNLNNKGETRITLYNEVSSMDVAQKALNNLDHLVEKNIRTYHRSRVLLDKVKSASWYSFRHS